MRRVCELESVFLFFDFRTALELEQQQISCASDAALHKAIHSNRNTNRSCTNFVRSIMHCEIPIPMVAIWAMNWVKWIDAPIRNIATFCDYVFEHWLHRLLRRAALSDLSLLIHVEWRFKHVSMHTNKSFTDLHFEELVTVVKVITYSQFMNSLDVVIVSLNN